MSMIVSAVMLLSALGSQENAARPVEKLHVNCPSSAVSSNAKTVETAEERTARLDRDFQKALMLMDKCIKKVTVDVTSAGGGSTGVGASGGGAGSNSANGANSSSRSVANGASAAQSSGGLKGTDPAEKSERKDVGEGTYSGADENASERASQSTQNDQASGSAANGAGESSSGATESPKNSTINATPEDIPSSQGDDIVAKQLRELAENEKDPVLRKKYWNQYRKYRGLKPVK